MRLECGTGNKKEREGGKKGRRGKKKCVVLRSLCPTTALTHIATRGQHCAARGASVAGFARKIPVCGGGRVGARARVHFNL